MVKPVFGQPFFSYKLADFLQRPGLIGKGSYMEHLHTFPFRHGKKLDVAGLLDALRSLEHGPWWPPLDELIDGARRFYAGGLTETQPAPA